MIAYEALNYVKYDIYKSLLGNLLLFGSLMGISDVKILENSLPPSSPIHTHKHALNFLCNMQPQVGGLPGILSVHSG